MNLSLFRKDFTPFSVGFDRFFQEVDSILGQDNSYPPYNIVEDHEKGYIIEIALAGFPKDKIEVKFHKGNLTVKGKRKDTEERKYLHHGIGYRQFKRVFRLANGVEVQSSSFENGILRINLAVTEELQSKTIEIN